MPDDSPKLFQRGRILFPTDFSEFANSAFPLAVGLAKRYQARLNMLHVIGQDVPFDTSSSSGFPSIREFYRELVQHAERQLDEEASRGERDFGFKAKKLVVRGSKPAEGILAFCREKHFDLIVMASRGRSSLGQLLTGSQAEHVIRMSGVDVFCITDPAHTCIRAGTDELAVSSILVPFDFSPPSRTAAARAARFAADTGAKLTLYHAAPGGDQRRAKKGLHEIQRWLDPHGIEVETMIGEGKASPAIIAAADEIDADLIVMSTMGHDAVIDQLIGSTTERVLRNTHRPVWVVKTKSDSR